MYILLSIFSFRYWHLTTALGKFWILDADGLITTARGDIFDETTRRFARPDGGDGLDDGANVEEV